MTLHQVRIFNAIAKHLSITKAARELHVSQPSISKQLRLLEKERRLKLHTRSGQGINLTEAGRQFWDSTRRILNELEGLPKTAVTDPRVSVLRVAATESPSASIVPNAFKEFRKIHPRARLVLRTSDSRAVEHMLLRAEVEVGIITYPSYSSGITVETLCSSDVAAVVTARHPLARKGKLAQDDLYKIPFIIKSNGRIEALLKQKRLNLRVVMRCESGEAVRAAVESGLGVGLLYRENVEHGLRDGYLKPIEFPWISEIRFNWFIIHRAGVTLSPNARVFMDLLRKLQC